MSLKKPDLAAEQADLWAQWYGSNDGGELKEWGRQVEQERLAQQASEKDPLGGIARLGSVLVPKLLLVACLLCLPRGALWAETAPDSELLQFLRHHEAAGSYDNYHGDIKTPPPKPLTRMSVGEVLAWQRSLYILEADDLVSTAAGGYQIVHKTLSHLVRKHRVSSDTRFDARLQDRLARHLIADCSGARARSNVAFANCLAGIWAALPLVSGPKKGLSAYHGKAGNRATTTPEKVLAVLAGLPFEPDTMVAAGGSTPATSSTRRANTNRYVEIQAAMTRTNTEAQNSAPKLVWTTDPYASE